MKNKVMMITFFMVLLVITKVSIAQIDNQDIRFGKYKVLNSEILNEDRLLYVHLPADYETTNNKYPVVFQLYSHFMYTYYLPAIRTANSMGELGYAPNMIVVGVKNRENRYRDLLPVDYWDGTSEIDKFVRFFEEELIPWVDANYRTVDYRILAGPQAGAAFGIYTFSEKPKMFNAMFLTNPFMVLSSREILLPKFREGIAKNDYANKFMMISNPPNIGPNTQKTMDELSRMAMRIKSENFTYLVNIIDPERDFTEPVDIIKGMKTLFKDYAFPAENTPQDLKTITAYYQNVSKDLGFKIISPELALVREGDKFNRDKEYDKALEIFQEMYKLYPAGLMSRDRMGDVYTKIGKPELALKYYEEFLKLRPDNPRMKTLIEQLKKKDK